MRPLHPVPVVLGFDAAYAKYAAVCILSACLNSSQRHTFYCFIDAVSSDDTSLFQKICDMFDCRIVFRRVDLTLMEGWKPFRHIEKASYYRVSMMKDLQVEKCLYIDADTLVTVDLVPLLDLDLGEHTVGVVLDPSGEQINMPMKDTSNYFNAGVMLIDLKKLQKMGIASEFSRVYREYEQSIAYADQCVLNHILEGHQMAIASHWNRFYHALYLADQGGITEADFTIDGEPAVLHYSGPLKPWMAWCSDAMTTYWLSYARLLGFDRGRIIRQPVTLKEVYTMAEKHEKAGDYKASAALKAQIINHLIEQESVRRSSSGPGGVGPR